ncbi:MAG TPA: DUF4258 domain-containing protein, partial [Candidatus Limnocylindrales bacterium]|nr:DUF4258 domain-containing protein [Candidatus Limnocylindrales bacterium]
MSEPAYRLSDHARDEAARRGISPSMLHMVMTQPEQVVGAYSGRKAYQLKVEIDGKLYIVRAIVEPADPVVVITV